MRFFVLLMAAWGLMWLSGCAFEEGNSQDDLYATNQAGLTTYAGDRPNVVRTHLPEEPRSLHPVMTNTADKTYVLTYGFQRLLALDPEGNLMPQLAKELPAVSADQLTYSFVLDPAARWPDGAPVTAQDVLFSFKALTQNRALAPYLAPLAEVTSPEEGIVVVRTQYYDFLNPYIGNYGMILDRRQFDPEGALDPYSVAQMLDPDSEAYQDPVVQQWIEGFTDLELGRNVDLLGTGSGPYRLVSWDANDGIYLARQKDYWAAGREDFIHAQHPDTIHFAFMGGDDAALQLKQQTLDVSLFIGSQTWLDLANGSPIIEQHFRLDTALTYGLNTMVLNNQPKAEARQPFFVDARVRRAVALALPLREIIADQLGGLAQMTATPVPGDNVFFNAELKPLPYDRAQARALLTRAGWVDSNGDGTRDSMIDGERIEFVVDLYRPDAANAQVQAAVQRIKEELQAVGMGVNFTGGSISTFYPQTVQRDFDMGLMLLPAGATPYDFSPLWHSDAIGGFNMSGYRNAEVDQLITELRREPDGDLQREKALRIQEILYREMPVVYLFNTYQKSAVHRRFNYDELLPQPPYLPLNTLRMIPVEP